MKNNKKPNQPQPKKSVPAPRRMNADNEQIESPMNEGMERNLGKEPEYQQNVVKRKNYKSGSGWTN